MRLLLAADMFYKCAQACIYYRGLHSSCNVHRGLKPQATKTTVHVEASQVLLHISSELAVGKDEKMSLIIFSDAISMSTKKYSDNGAKRTVLGAKKKILLAATCTVVFCGLWFSALCCKTNGSSVYSEWHLYTFTRHVRLLTLTLHTHSPL